MPACLGLYIESNLIKYAKVSKSNETIKVESFGIKFYENLQTTVKQIIEETYSFKTPISVNVSDEIYNKMEIFSLLSKKDISNVIKTEFENICYDKETNANVFEQRYLIADSSVKNEKVQVIHISATKTNIAQRKNELSPYKVSNVLPVPIVIANLLKKEKKTTVLVVNIENTTTITKVYNNLVSEVINLPIGAKNIIESINNRENSYMKAYEICKNSTIYTESDKDLQYEENEYLVDIMPTLFQIITEVRKITEESMDRIEKIFITGIASVINNIDIYFQEYLRDIQCEILKPSFISNNSKLNIKDYIEVNSAIALALQGLAKDNEVNFVKESILNKTTNLLKMDMSFKNKGNTSNSIGNFLEKFNSQYNILVYSFCLLTICYFMVVFIINKQMDNQIRLANNSIQTTNSRIGRIQSYDSKLKEQTSNYERLIRNIESINAANSEDKRYRNTIPNLLNNIMVVIPKSVQLVSIENTSSDNIVIVAKTLKYEQIAFFKTKLKTEGILNNIVSDTGTNQNGNIIVTIQGELP